jgi:phage shock protein C
MNCNDAVAAWIASFESGEPMSDAQREHIRTCSRCHELVDSAKQFQSLLAGNGIAEPALDATIAAAEDEARRKRVRRVTAVIVGLATILFAAVMFMIFPFGKTFTLHDQLFALGAGIAVAIGLAVPVIAVLLVVRGATTRRLYKRLHTGKLLSGVCLGIAESFGWNVTIVRLAFLLLLFFDGIGFWLYLVLDLVMPVHPDDRRHLWRFRLQRWWRERHAS